MCFIRERERVMEGNLRRPEEDLTVPIQELIDQFYGHERVIYRVLMREFFSLTVGKVVNSKFS